MNIRITKEQAHTIIDQAEALTYSNWVENVLTRSGGVQACGCLTGTIVLSQFPLANQDQVGDYVRDETHRDQAPESLEALSDAYEALVSGHNEEEGSMKLDPVDDVEALREMAHEAIDQANAEWPIVFGLKAQELFE